MGRPNQVEVDADIGRFVCISCHNRVFGSEHALIQHCRSSVHLGEWCDRCERLFVSVQACSTHVRDSYSHWTCRFCGIDMMDEDGLDHHYAEAHNFCYDCDYAFDDYNSHRIERHYRCEGCCEDFDNENELTMHKQVHLPRNKECYGCYKRFATDAAIVLHLETGTCPSGVTHEDVERWAFQCSQHHTFTNGVDYDEPFRCPRCNSNFAYVSALFQHIESPACSAMYKDGLAQLRRRLMTRATETGSSESSY